ncbi:hypothetical protein [Desulfonatronum sp. SC1]|nr:hypothetical protein [Desulfonatronum sp. SC1]
MSKHAGFGEHFQNALTARRIAAVLDAALVPTASELTFRGLTVWSRP